TTPHQRSHAPPVSCQASMGALPLLRARGDFAGLLPAHRLSEKLLLGRGASQPPVGACGTQRRTHGYQMADRGFLGRLLRGYRRPAGLVNPDTAYNGWITLYPGVPMSRSIEHNAPRQRFEWTEDGIVSELDYQLQNGLMSITHTGVPEALGGRGIAADLTK